MRLLLNRIAVVRDEEVNTSANGIILSAIIPQKSETGVVKFVGPGKPDQPMILKVGDKVKFSKHAGMEFSHNGVDLLLMRDDDVLYTI
jgi:chaperonin GroES